MNQLHIVVCIKQVPDTTQVRIDPETNSLVREGIPSILNPYDLHAIEAALRARDEYGGKVTALTMGPAQADEVLREAIALGVDDGILLTDRAFAGSDTLATSRVLAAGIEKIAAGRPVDLVICGKQSIDGDTAQVGPGVAQRLRFSQLTYVSKIRKLDHRAGCIVVERQLESGIEILKSSMPALLTVVKEMNEVRRAALPHLIRAAKFSPTVFTHEVLGLDKAKIGLKGSATTVRRIFAPSPVAGGQIITENRSVGGAVDYLWDRLIEADLAAACE